jgi:hypothetical protein
VNPPNPPQLQTCGSWSVKEGGPTNACGPDFMYTATDSSYCLADGSNCQTACCTYDETSQECGAWCVTLGGSPNCCGTGYVFSGGNDSDYCLSDGSNCQSSCCVPVVY